MSSPTPKRILIISNGHGEDSIAASIVGNLGPNIAVHAYPVIGEGAAFEGLCQVVGPRSVVPSQGWRHAKGSVLKDLPAMIASVGPAVAFLRSNKSHYDKVVVVGDMVGVLLCWWAGVPVNLYLDVFKVGQAHSYSSLERGVLRRTCLKVFCRDHMLASQLRRSGVNATSYGNIMLDTATRSPDILPAPAQGTTAIALLPGSRRTTSDAFALQAAALRKAGLETNVGAYLALADGISLEELAHRSGFQVSTGDSAQAMLLSPDLDIVVLRRATGNIIDVADIVLSQSGTATQQALGAGKPVITFYPPEHREKRMKDEQALMGEARVLVPPTAEALSEALVRLIEDPQLRHRLGMIGRERLGRAGTLKAVVEELEGT